MCTRQNRGHVLSSQVRGIAEKCLSPTVGIRTFSAETPEEKCRSDGVCPLPVDAKIAT